MRFVITAVFSAALALSVSLVAANAQNPGAKSKAGGSKRAACVAKYKVFNDAFDHSAGGYLDESDWEPGEKDQAFPVFMATCMKFGPNSQQVRQIIEAAKSN